MLDYTLYSSFDSFVDPKTLIFVLNLSSCFSIAGYKYAAKIPGGGNEVSAAAERPGQRNVRELRCMEQSVGPNHVYFGGFLESAAVFTALVLQPHSESTEEGVLPKPALQN